MNAKRVEAPNMDLTGAAWRKSSYSGNNGGECVEVAAHASKSGGLCLVRDSKNPDGPVLAVSLHAWQRFADQVKADAS